MPQEPSGRDLTSFVYRVWVTILLVAAMGGAILLLWLAYKVALLFFASVLLAIFLRTLADWVSQRTGLAMGWSLALVILGLLTLAGLFGWLLATPISREAERLNQTVPAAIAQLQKNLEGYSWGRAIMARIHQPASITSQVGNLFAKAGSFFSVTIEGILYVLVVLFCGFYLAVQPEVYVEGFLKLIPLSRRPRTKVVLREVGAGLRHWLFGQIVAMTIIGLLTWLGLHLLHVPLSAALGLLAGILDFVPVVGPWVAGILSSMLALLRSPMHAVYVACLFVGLHLFEGHVLIPLVQRKAARLPPVLTILAMVLFALLFGFLGLFLATPLLALVLIVTKALYVEDVLDDHA